MVATTNCHFAYPYMKISQCLLFERLNYSLNIVELSVVDQVPSPPVAQRIRIPKMLYPDDYQAHTTANNDLEKALYECDRSDSAPIVAYVSKMFSVPNEMLPENKRQQMSAEEMRAKGRVQREKLKGEPATIGSEGSVPVSLDEGGVFSPPPEPEISQQPSGEKNSAELVDGNDDIAKETLIGFARLYSGTIRVGQKLFVLGPKFDPAFPDKYCSEITVRNLYLMMGRELFVLDAVPAGNVFGIGGLEGHVLKNGTISSTKTCKNLAGIKFEVTFLI